MTNPANTVNDVITDSVTQTGTLITGSAAPQGMAMIDVVSAETLGMAMHNAVSAQQNAQLTANASVTSSCAKMLAIERISLPTTKSKKDTPPPFMPLKGDNKTDPNSLISMAGSLAENAIEQLKKQGSADEATQKALSDLITKLSQANGAPKATGDPNDKKTDQKTDGEKQNDKGTKTGDES
jgi:hypothetical protein